MPDEAPVQTELVVELLVLVVQSLLQRGHRLNSGNSKAQSVAAYAFAKADDGPQRAAQRTAAEEQPTNHPPGVGLHVPLQNEVDALHGALQLLRRELTR